MTAPVWLFCTEEGIYLRKKVGQVSSLRSICTEDVDSHCGIGHTRWATHGGVTDANAHPHVVGRVVLLHNGIIENYRAISVQFGFEGLATSETDTEVAAQLINYYYDKTNDPYQAIRNAIRIIDGSYAFCIMFDDRPGTIYAVRNVSPMVATTASQGAFIASDVTALIPYSKDYFVVPEHHILTITADGIRVETMDGVEVQPEILSVNWDVEAAQKGGYPHFMLKEIHEQPEVFRKTIRPRLNNGLPDFSQESIPDDIFPRVYTHPGYRLRNRHVCWYGRQSHYGKGASNSGNCFYCFRVSLRHASHGSAYACNCCIPVRRDH